MSDPIILRSSSSGFAWGTLVHSHYKSACLRWILIQSHRSFEIAKKYQILGLANEDRHAAALQEKGIYFTRELEVERDSPVEGVVNRGHIDFLVTLPFTNELEVHELKHVQSVNVRREVIRKGLYTSDNLAQCVNYMLHAQTDHGLLKYTFWEHGKKDGKASATEEREFKVKIEEFGRISVDGVPTKFTAHDQLNHQKLAATVLKYQIVAPDRPHLGNTSPFSGACRSCPAQAACDKFDQGAIEGTDAFVETSKQLIQEKEQANDDAEVQV